MRLIRNLLPLLFTAGLVLALNGLIPGMPPLGSLLSPWHGFWQNAETGDPVADTEELRIPGLKDKVEVVYDKRMVPHIFAQNNHDLYLAQGYVTAQLRLWQMETQTRYAAGRLSEVFGPGPTVDIDRRFRRMGLEWAAKRSLHAMMQNPTTRDMLLAYTEGVNAYIDQLKPSQYPLMYKLKDYAPRRWEPLHTALLLKYMTWDLTGNSTDLQLSLVAERHGPQVVTELFPDYPTYLYPGVPDSLLPADLPRHAVATTNWAVPPAAPPATAPAVAPGAPTQPVPGVTPSPANGSNNWAIGGKRTRSGYPLLANDPHLHLSLPSVWFELQLHGPDVNVYGVSLPGAPGVIVGFNEGASWGVTNLTADVLDWYHIQMDKPRQHYKHDGKWKPLISRRDTVFVKGEEPRIEVTWHTHHGPIVWADKDRDGIPAGHAMRWAGHEGGNELLTFYLLNRAQTYDTYRTALETYYCPGQNFVYADTTGTIALWSHGRVPLKKQGQGKLLLDGSKTEDDWNGWVPLKDNPHLVNPGRQWVASANHLPAGRAYPYYLGWDFASWERAARIQEYLDGERRATPDHMRRLQTDNTHMLAQKTLPRLLEHLKAGLDRKELNNADMAHALHALEEWDYRCEAGSLGASYFHYWWTELDSAIWRDQFSPPLRYPDRDVTAHLIATSDTSRWYDNVRTYREVEDLRSLAVSSFVRSVKAMAQREPDRKLRTWSRIRHTHIDHMSYVEALGIPYVETGGMRHAVNALDSDHGPSWRMVVAVGPRVQGYGIYPGGQSENPGSAYYDNFVEEWRLNKLADLLFARKPEDLKASQRVATVNMRGQ